MAADPTGTLVRPPAAPHLDLLLGGVRSGKSAHAVELAREWAPEGRVLFVATAQPLDADMSRRIAAHRAERPAGWATLEAPMELAAGLGRAMDDPSAARPDVVIVDCLTLWVSNLLLATADSADIEQRVAAHAAELLDLLRALPPARWILVSNEVGLGIVPHTALGRRYRDALGRVNRLVAVAADRVTLMVAGLEMRLK